MSDYQRVSLANPGNHVQDVGRRARIASGLTAPHSLIGVNRARPRDGLSRPCRVGMACMLALLFWAGCGPEKPESPGTPTPPPPAQDRAELTLLLTGQALSTLKPCGCSENQLGGLSRRQSILNTVPPDRRLVIDTGGLLAADSEQDRIKLEVLFQALTILDYDLVHLDPKDYDIARQRGLLQAASFDWITSAPSAGPDPQLRRWSRTIDLEGQQVRVVVAAMRADAMTPQALAEVFGPESAGPRLHVVITPDEPPVEPDVVSQWSGVDLVIRPAAANEPQVLHDGAAGPWVVSVGRLGEYIARVGVRWGADNRPRFQFKEVAVDERLPEDTLLVELYENYKLRIKEERLIDRMPQLPLPDDLEYVGSGTCKSCHEYEYERWSTKKHARAYRTLVEINQQYDPECIACHVVGFGYVSGFRNETSPTDLRDVGCEVCHGPGSAHVAAQFSGGQYVAPGRPRLGCIDCHTPEHSVGYAGHEEEYLRKIVHWREQKSP